MIVIMFPKKGVPGSAKGGWVDPTWDKVLNSTVFGFILRHLHLRLNIVSQKKNIGQEKSL